MCGRFVSASPPDELARYFGAQPPDNELEPNFNVAPTTEIYVVRAREGHRQLASGSEDHTVKLWDTETGQLVRTFQHNNAVDCVAFSPEGEVLASGDRDHMRSCAETCPGPRFRWRPS